MKTSLLTVLMILGLFSGIFSHPPKGDLTYCSYARFQFGVGKIGEVLYELDEFLDGVEEFTEELVEGICEPVEDWAVSHFGPKE